MALVLSLPPFTWNWNPGCPRGGPLGKDKPTAAGLSLLSSEE